MPSAVESQPEWRKLEKSKIDLKGRKRNMPF
jgi:hypothetical protein